MLLAALALLVRMCSTGVCIQNKPAAVAPKGEHITHHFFVSGIGQKKTVVQPKFVAAQKMLKQETQQTFVNGLLGFITLKHLYSAGSACVLLTIIA